MTSPGQYNQHHDKVPAITARRHAAAGVYKHLHLYTSTPQHLMQSSFHERRGLEQPGPAIGFDFSG
ncbi:MAG TPA: hypothetical protein VJ302_31835, partial [Blastocatellia bacterium]|nr:hypothetical protein [Blastocatellia bacterium]